MNTDEQLKQALAKMLPDLIGVNPDEPVGIIRWKSKPNGYYLEHHVLDTELLHLCWLVEETLEADQWNDYIGYVIADTHSIFTYEHLLHATWKQRVTALSKVKGIEIV